jgi:hypothetical protein
MTWTDPLKNTNKEHMFINQNNIEKEIEHFEN